MDRLAYVLCLACLTFAIAPAVGQDRDNIVIGEWRGGAQTNQNGDYRFCSVGVPRSGGTNMILYWRESGFSVSLYNDLWELPEGSSYTVSAAIDRRWAGDVTGEAYSTTAINFSFGHDADTVAAFRLGSRLTIDAADATFRFDLNGTNAAIAALQDCHRRHSGGRRDVAGSTPEDPTGFPGMETDAGAWTFYERIDDPDFDFVLIRSLMTEFVSPSAEIREPGPDDRWSHFLIDDPQAPGWLLGSYNEIRIFSVTLDRAILLFTLKNERMCGGTAHSRFLSPIEIDEFTVAAVFTECEDNDHVAFNAWIYLDLADHMHVYTITSDRQSFGYAERLSVNLTAALQEYASVLAETRRASGSQSGAK